MPYVETPPTITSLRAQLTAAVHWPSATGPPRVVLTNNGPAGARDIGYSISTLPDTGPPHSRAGPWQLDRLKTGEADARDVCGFYASVALVTATWTDDDDGTHDLSWTIEFPDRPAPQSPPRSRSR